MTTSITGNQHFDVIIVGGSYAGLAAAMALGRALRRVLIIDGGKPANRQTPHSHNFLTQDGRTPAEIAELGRQQVEAYETVQFREGLVTAGWRTEAGFGLRTESGQEFTSRKLIFATGIKDLLPEIEGVADCWGISVLHCPFCHGYEVRNEATGILAGGDAGFEFARLIANWTPNLRLLTNGDAGLSAEQAVQLAAHGVTVVEQEIERLEHEQGSLRFVQFKDGTKLPLAALYTRPAFEQHCAALADLGCELTEQGYIKVDALQHTTVPGVFACGDNASSMRTVANAVGSGTTAGMTASKELALEDF
jgi:thioredoxin reductase